MKKMVNFIINCIIISLMPDNRPNNAIIRRIYGIIVVIRESNNEIHVEFIKIVLDF